MYLDHGVLGSLGFGALVTGITIIVVLVAKFVEGAWITELFIPLTIVFFIAVRRHYHSVKVLTTCKVPVHAASLNQPPIVVIPIGRWSNITASELNLPPGFHVGERT